MLSVDVKNALLDVNPKFSAALLDWEDLQQEDVPEGISGGYSGGGAVVAVNFRTFAVICALYEIGEDERDFGVLTRSRSLDGKLKWCKLYYKRLLGPDRRVLESDLIASGMTSRQCSAIVEKLASREQGRGQLDFMEFVAYLPLFMEGHQHIVRSPLGT